MEEILLCTHDPIRTVSPEMPVIVVGGPECEADALSLRVPVDLEELRELISSIHQSNKITDN